MRRRDVLAGATALLARPTPGRAKEAGAVAIARQPSLGHLPLMLMEEQGLLQKAATPRAVGKVAAFMARTGTIRRRPESWKDLFLAGVHARDGS